MPRTGRPRAFDVAETLDHARDVFWASGYGGTSIQALVDALDVERGSLYGAFGDKRHLYLETVKLYWAEYEVTLRGALESTPLLPALRNVLALAARPATIATAGDQPNGCMMGNTAAELVPQDDDATAIVRRSFTTFVDIVAEALGDAQARGEVATTATPTAQAQLLLAVAQGTSLISRSGASAEALVGAIDAVIAGLKAS